MELNKYANTFKALSDANRLRILSILNLEDEVCACKILEQLNITQPTFVYHMKMLLDTGLVTCYKRGTWCIYKIEYEELNRVKAVLSNFNFEEEIK